MKKLLTFLTLTLLICGIAGCMSGKSESELLKLRTESPEPQTAFDTIDYLKKQNLPAVESIEKWFNKYGEGLIITTDHYVIYTTLLEPLMLYQVPGFMESAYRGYQDQLPSSIKTKTKFTVYLFATREQWEDFTKFFTGPAAPVYLKIQKGAYVLNDICVAYNIGRTATFSVLGHEGWHQFNERYFALRLPSCLDEGVAMLFEASRYDKGWFTFEPDKNLGRLGGLKITLAKGKMIPLKELIGLNPGEILSYHLETGTNTEAETEVITEAAIAFYAQSYALVRFLREEGYGKRLRNFHQLMLGGLRGDWPLNEAQLAMGESRGTAPTATWNRQVANQLFKTYISDELDALDSEYVTFCKKLVYRIHPRKKQ